MNRRPKLLFLLPFLALVLIAAAFMLPSTAHAAAASKVLKSSPRYTWAKGYVPKSGGGPTNSNLIYHGGPVMAGTMQVFAIFWEPDGSFVSPTYNQLLKRYFRDVGASALYENNEQYTATGTTAPLNANLRSTWKDETPYPSNPISDADIQNEVAHAMSVNGWQPGIGHMFFVFTAKNELICNGPECSFTVFCGYHSAFGTVAAPVIYAAMPYDGTDLAACGPEASTSPNNDADADAEINVTSHEQIEAATDPIFNGWFGVNGGADEIGDKCNFFFGPRNADGSNVSFNGHPYIVQEEWDNTAPGCVLSGPTNETFD